jgi:hypothetical protein
MARSREAWVWGLDTGSKRCGLACIEIPTGRFATYAAEWRSDREKGGAMPLSPSLELAFHHTRELARAIVSHRRPATIAFEQPMGTHGNPSLVMHAGVEVLALTKETDVAPWAINVSTWKRLTGLRAKPDLLPWIQSLGYPIDDEDQAAALAIAAGAAHEFYGDAAHGPLVPCTPPARKAA